MGDGIGWNGKDDVGRGVTERGFEIERQGRVIPGVYWTPSDTNGDRLVLLGHGGTAHKNIDYISGLAHALCRRGFAAMAIDGPGHGDRPNASLVDVDDPKAFAKRWYHDGGTAEIVPDWSAALDFIEAEHGSRPAGWWGLSMGTMMGLPVTVAEPRISVAVLGLMGNWGPNAEDLMAAAPDLQVPVRFLLQWDDEVVPRDLCLELFDALGAQRKTMHANPGLHAAVPAFEVAASVDYLERYVK